MSGIAELTDREREVLSLLLAGHTAKSAAAELDLSVHTVNDYLREARKKLGVSSSREAARILGEHEAQVPQNLGPQQMGMAEGQPAPHLARMKSGSRKVWIIGGIIMLTALAILALVTTTQSGSEDAAADDAVTAAPMAKSDTGTSTASPADIASARDWLALVDAGNWEESWQEAGAFFRQSVTAAEWAAQVRPVREPIGAVQSRELANQQIAESLPGAPAGTYLVLQFDTDFANKPDSVETVVMADEGGEWGVVGYFVR
ncbi:DUF4019 domain-containing protein [Altererythrobacter aurantiacus]|uniref:DUF4019 domain-containing protein n=1 Tax=Parapontixanthobacter aurantiacus TaxID=1463599 RepID=A0A844ZEI8_9SPHN|nr:DUF4019 domain-containing protein [Parapontixanthobacter aurantiacus]MXO85954.1 DUF4019 domain-containing protein [Parapontixanthobacter aurantiacus]